jgi:Ca-activated chloride channel family protein
VIFEWPGLLWVLLLVPLLALVYLAMERHRQAATLAVSRWSTRAHVASPRSRRVLPPVLYLVALVLLIGAMARPVAVVTLPSLRDVIILAIDVSNSMLAEDVAPTRLAVAKNAAREFIEEQPVTTRIGIVAFAETALAVQRPTTSREDLLQTIDRLEPQAGTALGSAIVVSLQALFPGELIEVGVANESGDNALDSGQSSELSPDSLSPGSPPVAPGSDKSAAIVLLSDGAATAGPNPIEAARLAAARGVRVFTVGLGTEEGAVVSMDGISMRVAMDAETLKDVADVTLARFFTAGDAEELRAIYREVSTRLVTEARETELSAVFVAVAALLTLLAAGLSMLWFNRIL